MIINIKTGNEADSFFDQLLPLLPKNSFFRESFEPSQQLLDLAWDTAQIHHNYLWDKGLYHEKIISLAASDGSHQDKPMTFEGLGGDWSLTREDIPDNKEWQILKFKCREEIIKQFRGIKIVVTIADKKYELGGVNRRGVAEAEIPYGLDFQQLTDIAFPKI
jgi:hypothetical protein